MKHKKIIFGLLIGFLLLGAALGYFFGASRLPKKLNSSPANVHYSTFSQKDFFEKAYNSSVTVRPKQEIFGLIVNHHLLAPHLMAEAFKIVETDKKRTVVILSPNHFSVGAGTVLTSAWAWQTPYGELEPDIKSINSLVSTGLVNIEEGPFGKEHGIANIVAFVKRSIPNALVIPLIFRSTLTLEKASELAAVLKKYLLAGSLVIGSLDFSHMKTSDQAELEDAKSLAVINNFDYQNIQGLDIDSKPALSCLLRYFELEDAKKFNLLEHTNSSKLLNKLDSHETTSYITGYFSSE